MNKKVFYLVFVIMTMLLISCSSQKTPGNQDANKPGDESNSDQSKIAYSSVNRDCMSTEFAKGYTENTEIDYLSKKDSCGFELTYDQGGEFATLKLDYPITSTLQTCSTSKDVRIHDKDVLLGTVVEEQPISLGGKNAYKVITKYSGYNYITVYVCLSSGTYNWGGSPVNALLVTGPYTDDFGREVVDHALANWHWK